MTNQTRRRSPWSALLLLTAGALIGAALIWLLAPPRTASVPTPTTAPPTAAPAPASPAAPTSPARPDLTRQRPYSPDSPWNTPIGPAPKYDPRSEEMVATIALKAQGRITADASNYSYTLYFVDSSTPRWDIPCTRYKCTVFKPDGALRTDMLPNVPLPADAAPSSGTDLQAIVVDTSTYAEYNLWGLERTADGWTSRNGSIYDIRLDATPTNFGSRGAGVPYYAGLIRPWEIVQGQIDHAIAFAYPYPAEDRCVYPASKTDGNSALPEAIPEGARLQLDPALTEADFDRMGLDRTGKIIARALQQYGMILINYAGRPKINIENLEDNPSTTQRWSDPDLNLPFDVIANIPYTSFRVIALPPAYWNPAPDSPMHGKCYAYADSSTSASGG